MRSARVLGLVAAVASLAGCGGSRTPAAPSEPLVVTSTTSFGFCPPTSFCETALEVADGFVTFTKKSRVGDVERQQARLSAEEWASLKQRALDARFEGLAPVIGCPDCADGGAESVAVVSANASKSVTFEYGATIPSIAPLVESLRVIRARFQST